MIILCALLATLIQLKTLPNINSNLGGQLPATV